MSNLYEDPDWSQKDMEATLKDARKHVLKNKLTSCFSISRLKYYLKELYRRSQEGYEISFTDLWGLIIEGLLHDGVLCVLLLFLIVQFFYFPRNISRT